MFDRIEVWTIGREVLEDMSCIKDRLLCVAALVKAGIVHDQDAAYFSTQ